MLKNFYSLRKSRKTLRILHRLYRRKVKTLPSSSKEEVEKYLLLLQGAIIQKDAKEAKKIAEEFQSASDRLMPKTSFDKAFEFSVGMIFALVVAVLIRTMWFELYTIPSGSMRPTLKEEDYLIVSKTDFGINVPLKPAHFYFDENLVQRNSVVVFNGANIDLPDTDTTYFYLFPGKKQFVKRLIGKPGDNIYFYGGEIFGVDIDGKEIEEFRDYAFLEHVPMIRFDGKVEMPNPPKGGIFSPVYFSQMNQPLAKLTVNSIGVTQGEVLGIKGNYSDFLGMKNFAQSRLLTKAQVEKIHPQLSEGLSDAPLYLELTHHPSIQGAQLIRDEYGRMRPDLAYSTSIIPLKQEHIKRISRHMTTCRFIVKNEKAWRFGWNAKDLGAYLPTLPGVPDGTYEIQDGKAYKLPFPSLPLIGLFTNGYAKELPKSHPLYSQDPEQILKLYDLGIEFLNQFLPQSKSQRITPSRYAYFKDGDLYLLGSPIVLKDEQTMAEFIQRELEKKAISTSFSPYTPFIDEGRPSLDEIKKFGVKVPEKMYLVLGDNHAMSADSRQFGFVPEENLKGGVSTIFAPIGPRVGKVEQPKISYATLPNIVVWTSFIIIAIGSSIYLRKKAAKPLKF